MTLFYSLFYSLGELAWAAAWTVGMFHPVLGWNHG